jgi:hypothetical protein
MTCFAVGDISSQKIYLLQPEGENKSILNTGIEI